MCVCKNVLQLNKKVILKYTGAFVTMQGEDGSSWKLPLEGFNLSYLCSFYPKKESQNES